MNPLDNRTTHLLALGVVLTGGLLAAVLRVFPSEWNCASVRALALFAGARLRPALACALPLVVMLGTDALLSGLRGYPFLYAGSPFVYGSFLLYVLLGRLLTRTENPLAVGAGAVAGSLQFFAFTNFGVWLTSAVMFPGSPHSYPPTLAGLLDCYAQGLPFLRGTLGGDLVFTALLFGSHACLTQWLTAPRTVPQPLALPQEYPHEVRRDH